MKLVSAILSPGYKYTLPRRHFPFNVVSIMFAIMSTVNKSALTMKSRSYAFITRSQNGGH